MALPLLLSCIRAETRPAGLQWRNASASITEGFDYDMRGKQVPHNQGWGHGRTNYWDDRSKPKAATRWSVRAIVHLLILQSHRPTPRRHGAPV